MTCVEICINYSVGMFKTSHYHDVIMSTMASEITSLTLVYSTVYSRRRSKKTSKLRVTGLCVGNSPVTVNSSHKGPVTRKMFPFDDVIMTCCSFIISVCALKWAFFSNSKSNHTICNSMTSSRYVIWPKCTQMKIYQFQLSPSSVYFSSVYSRFNDWFPKIWHKTNGFW